MTPTPNYAPSRGLHLTNRAVFMMERVCVYVSLHWIQKPPKNRPIFHKKSPRKEPYTLCSKSQKRAMYIMGKALDIIQRPPGKSPTYCKTPQNPSQNCPVYQSISTRKEPYMSWKNPTIPFKDPLNIALHIVRHHRTPPKLRCASFKIFSREKPYMSKKKPTIQFKDPPNRALHIVKPHRTPPKNCPVYQSKSTRKEPYMSW